MRDVRVDVGGKGVNVAVVLKRLGVPVSCVGCLGRARPGILPSDEFGRRACPSTNLPRPGEVRTNLKLLDNSTRAITEFNEPGISMDSAQLEDFLTLLREKAGESEHVVLSGRLPEGCAEATYQRCLKTLEGKKCVLDCAGETLLHGVKERPFLIKPNLPEIEGIMKKELRTLRGLRDAALFLIEYGAQNVIISMGKYGAMLVSRTDTFFAPALMVEAGPP